MTNIWKENINNECLRTSRRCERENGSKEGNKNSLLPLKKIIGEEGSEPLLVVKEKGDRWWGFNYCDEETKKDRRRW